MFVGVGVGVSVGGNGVLVAVGLGVGVYVAGNGVTVGVAVGVDVGVIKSHVVHAATGLNVFPLPSLLKCLTSKLAPSFLKTYMFPLGPISDNINDGTVIILIASQIVVPNTVIVCCP